MSNVELRERLVGILLDKIASDPHPSTTQMDHVERSMTDRTREAYLSVLLARIDDDPIPSPDLLNRVTRLLDG